MFILRLNKIVKKKFKKKNNNNIGSNKYVTSSEMS